MDEQFKLEVDASGSAMGAILLQRQPDGTKRPINFMSKTFNQAQRNYDIFDREFLAMIWGLQHSRPLLVGCDVSPHVRLDVGKARSQVKGGVASKRVWSKEFR